MPRRTAPDPPGPGASTGGVRGGRGLLRVSMTAIGSSAGLGDDTGARFDRLQLRVGSDGHGGRGAPVSQQQDATDAGHQRDGDPSPVDKLGSGRARPAHDDIARYVGQATAVAAAVIPITRRTWPARSR